MESIPNSYGFKILKEKSAETLSVASITIPRRSHEEWLAREL